MNCELVIQQLRDHCPPFAGRVGGAADYERADDAGQMALPAAYVVPLEYESGPNEQANGLVQVLTDRFAVMVQLDNSPDRRGQWSSDQIEALRLAVFAALLNWRIDPERAARGLEADGGGYIRSDRARYFYQFGFRLERTFTDDDGWQPPAEPLLGFDMALAPDGSAAALFARLDLPQE